MNLTFGYARVSTVSQTLDQQFDALVAAGVDPSRIYSDQLSGTRTDRPGLTALLGAARSGDEIVVIALDRLGRSLIHVVQTIEELTNQGIVLRSLRENIDFATPTGRLVAAVMASLAEYERELIRERSAAARAAAAARGRHIGRPRALTPDQVDLAKRMHAAGENIVTISRALAVSRATIYRAIDQAA
ncbi:MAG: recombinase family protein [Aeromicrobium sp.]